MALQVLHHSTHSIRAVPMGEADTYHPSRSLSEVYQNLKPANHRFAGFFLHGAYPFDQTHPFYQ
jgi:hypothetical protein